MSNNKGCSKSSYSPTPHFVCLITSYEMFLMTIRRCESNSSIIVRGKKKVNDGDEVKQLHDRDIKVRFHYLIELSKFVGS